MKPNPLVILHYGYLNGGSVLPISVTGYRAANKPVGEGILWGSPKGSAYGWPEWCMDEEPEWLNRPQWWIHLSPKMRLLTIDTLPDLKRVTRRYPASLFDGDLRLDWPALAKDYDAVWLTEKGQRKTLLSHPVDLYGWDCETVCVLTERVIERVEATQ